MTKRIDTKDLVVGTGDEATKDSIIVANVRTFLRRGDEVAPSPLFGARKVIDLAGRECIAGLRYGIPGMRVGGTREIVISPHLAYGKDGIPGSTTPNALLRCTVALLEIRQHSALLQADWLLGRSLIFRNTGAPEDQQSEWTFTLHEEGNAQLSFLETIESHQSRRPRVHQIPIPFKPELAEELIQQAINLPKQMPEDCIVWRAGFVETPSGQTVRDSRNSKHRMVVQVREGGRDECMIGVYENRLQFRNSVFYKTIQHLIEPHLPGDPVSRPS